MGQLDIGHVAKLVEDLYSPHHSSDVVETQKKLQEIQKSENGWLVAEQLLQLPSLNCKFFGALTYTVNLNLSISGLKKNKQFQQISELRNRLLSSLLALIGNDEVLNRGGLFVIKKMMSNLVLVYMNEPTEWTNPVLTLMFSVLNGDLASAESIGHVSDQGMSDILNTLPQRLVTVTIIFSQIIVEEVVKREATNSVSVEIHKNVHEFLFNTTQQLLIVSLSMYKDAEFLNVWLECLNSWIGYASKAEFDSTERYDMEQLLTLVISLVEQGDLQVTEKAVDTLSEALETNATFFKPIVKTRLNAMIFGDWGINYVRFKSSNEDESSVAQFARLAISFLDTDMINLAYKLHDDANDPKFEFLLSLTDYPGIPIDEESVSKEFADFWLRFADCCIVDDDRLLALLKDDSAALDRLNSKIQSLFDKVTQIYWKKIHIFDESPDFKTYKDEFLLFRRDVGDLFESLYPIVKLPLIHNLAGTILSNIGTNEDSSIKHIEASLYLLNSIAKDFSENSVDEQLLRTVAAILDADFLQLVLSTRSDKLQYIINTTIQFLSTADWFYKSKIGISYLPRILNFLFDCMINSSLYQLTSSKAIADICDDCRLSLSEFLPSFEAVITEMINNVSVEPLIRQRIIKSFSSILQGVKSPVVQGENLLKLFDLLEKKSLEMILQLDNTTDAEQVEKMLDYLTSLIGCVSAIGKGMQLPDDIEEVYNKEEENAVREYWTSDPLGIHSKILSVVNNFTMINSTLAENYGIMEESVNIFKCGLTEEIPGPFVFQQEVILEFVVRKFDTLRTPNTYPLLYSLCSSFIVSNFRQIQPEVVAEVVNKIFVSKLALIEEDPDLTQSSSKLFSTILTRKPSLLISNRPLLELLLDFGIRHLSSNERFVLKSLEAFWTRLITLRKGDRQDTVTVKRMFNETELGFRLTYNTLKYMFLTQRSNLESYTEILKTLVSKYPLLVSKWLEASFLKLNEERVQEGRKEIQKWDIFVKKVMLTRGTRNANELIKDFWLEVNGLVDYKK